MAEGETDAEARLAALAIELMEIPGLSGAEGRVRARLAEKVGTVAPEAGLHVDVLGNLSVDLPSTVGAAPAVFVFAHMDQLGFVVRKIEPDGWVRVERLGGVPERALAAQEVVFQVKGGGTVPGVIANKSHHATTPEEKYRVLPYAEIYVDTGLPGADAVRAAGIDVGTPVVYAPRAVRLGRHRLAGTAVDDRAACAVLVEVIAALSRPGVRRPPVTVAFSVQEEFNLRGVMPAVARAKPAIAIQLDLVLATDTPDMGARGDVRLGAGPAMSLYSFHGRGTLNGLIPHPRLVAHLEETAARVGIGLQRSAHVGALTETSYVQLAGDGVAAIDLGFPCRYTHSAREVCDVRDLAGLAELVVAAISGIGPDFDLAREGYEPMSAYLGIDIGTFESKGVLVDAEGTVLASAARPHRMIVPEPGFAEHRAEEDWWGDFAAISRELIATAGIDGRRIRAVAASAIGPCMLPVDAAGAPLANGVLYNVDTRSKADIAELSARLGDAVVLERCGNLLTAQSVGPKILWLARNRPTPSPAPTAS